MNNTNVVIRAVPELDSASHRFMGGFTLIELLVVVLIIGVLTAVAVPQYRKAVLKSRFSTLMPLAKNLWDSNEVFYLSNGGYAAGVDELDVSAPADPNVQAEVMDEENHQYVRVSNPNINNRLTMYQKHSPNFPEETHCEALLNDDLATWLCKDSLQGTFVGNKYGYAVYSLSPEAVGTLARTVYNTSGLTISDGDKCVATSGTQGCANAKISNGAICDGRGGAWYSCSNVQASDHAICYASVDGCGGSSSFSDHSVCVSSGAEGCYWGRFSNYSSCVGISAQGGYGGYGCRSPQYFKDHSVCFGVRKGNCAGGTYTTAYSENSACVGDATGTCGKSDFKTGSICYANVSGACTGNTYDETSCCAGGANCTNEADRCETKGITVPPQPTLPDY